MKTEKKRRSRSAYTPYGYTITTNTNCCALAYAGQLLDSLAEAYYLGNGTRAYSPSLMRFLSPDSASPFGEGGVNAYVYCLGNPINMTDPTGHWSEYVAKPLIIPRPKYNATTHSPAFRAERKTGLIKAQLSFEIDIQAVIRKKLASTIFDRAYPALQKVRSYLSGKELNYLPEPQTSLNLDKIKSSKNAAMLIDRFASNKIPTTMPKEALDLDDFATVFLVSSYKLDPSKTLAALNDRIRKLNNGSNYQAHIADTDILLRR